MYWVTSDPLIESAVHTTPPISRTCSIPSGPASPISASTTAVTMSVVSVIPETGVIEIMAMAQAETDAKRKAITRVSTVATAAMARARGFPAMTEKRK